MPRIAIVEDDLVCAKQLQDYVERYGRTAGDQFQTVLFPILWKLWRMTRLCGTSS